MCIYIYIYTCTYIAQGGEGLVDGAALLRYSK